MPWLLDTDVIWKLAEFDLFSEFLTILNTKKSELRCLPELAFQLKRERIYERFTREVVDRVREFMKGIKQIENADPGEQYILQNAKSTYQNRTERIDGGEQILFIATKVIAASLIVSHDKKALRTLARDSSCKPIYERIKGRVFCLEQIVLMMIDRFGYVNIQSKIGPHCECDAAIQECFANGRADFPETECRVWLNDYIVRLSTAAPGLLFVGQIKGSGV